MNQDLTRSVVPLSPGRAAMRAGIALATASVLAAPAHAALANGISIPFDAPSLYSFQAASVGANSYAYAKAFDLTPMTDPFGNVLTVTTPDGVGATAFKDAAGNVLVAYAYDASPAETNLGMAILSGYGPSQVPGYGEALEFLQAVEAVASAENIPTSRLYLTGFSLGGMLASYVGSQSGLPGVAFASCGLPGYTAPASPASNFISFLEPSDPVAQYGTDTFEHGSAVVANPHMDHYGTVFVLGTPNAELQSFSSSISGYSLPEYQSGSLPIPPAQAQALQNEYFDLINANHQMTLYDPDTDALARAYGIDPTAP